MNDFDDYLRCLHRTPAEPLDGFRWCYGVAAGDEFMVLRDVTLAEAIKLFPRDASALVSAHGTAASTLAAEALEECSELGWPDGEVSPSTAASLVRRCPAEAAEAAEACGLGADSILAMIGQLAEVLTDGVVAPEVAAWESARVLRLTTVAARLNATGRALVEFELEL